MNNLFGYTAAIFQTLYEDRKLVSAVITCSVTLYSFHKILKVQGLLASSHKSELDAERAISFLEKDYGKQRKWWALIAFSTILQSLFIIAPYYFD